MKYCLASYLFLLCSSMSAADLTVTAQLLAQRADLQVSFTNTDVAPLLLTVGFLQESHAVCACKLSISGPGIKSKTLSNLDDPGVVGGRTDPWIIVLPPKAEYILKFPTKRLMLDRDGVTLADIRQKTWKLIVTFKGRQAGDVAPGGKTIPYHITDIPFWRGSVVAEVVNR